MFRSGKRLILPMAVLVVAATACGSQGTGGDADIADRPIRVTTTTNWHTDLAQTIGGDRAEVTGLMAPGVDPHLYEASAGDVETLAESDMAIWNGLDLEGNMGEVFEQIGQTVPVVTVGEAVPADLLIEIEEDGVPAIDPHVWFEVDAWAAAAQAVAEAYQEIDPDNAAGYDERLAEFVTEMAAVDAEITEAVAQVPEQSRVLVTSHDAFTYFAQAYGFEVSAIQGVSTASEATTADIERVAATVAENELGAVFIESSVPAQTIDAVLAAAAARGQQTEVGGELFGDSLGAADSPEGDWAGALRYNAEMIVQGLSGDGAAS